ncbi:outer membrane beta-barrel protein [Chitinophaga sp. G-6-1-13]|uniref:Outer membrane beta-barrel protein n=1 Tax=Chitinophaga fulva TaxID=2728842 RepID=A0A848GJC1_9BACT|nr:carboxypeptidase-like regulatory domain-containing protein [Chitinophaga fulva]NML38366.1 outer membrane beta-barrel protein [Chitinophaga fulva]
MQATTTGFNQIKRQLVLLLLGCCASATLYAQHTIKGTVYQKDTRKTLPGAAVLLYDEKARIKAQTQSDEHGNFTIENVQIGFYRLLVSFMGNRTEMIPVEVNPRVKTVTFNYIQLSPSISLSRVEVKADRPLMSIRKDTIEFNAGELPTLPNANMHELIEKIPGLTMDDNGNLYYLGSPIKELFIDGRSLLQNMGNVKRVMEILKADLAEKIQISDKKNISGITEPGKNEKVLNIVVKDAMKKGVRGTVTGGCGTEDRYNAGTTFNMFRKKFTMLGDILANNNNTQSDASTNYQGSFMGNSQQGTNKIFNVGTYSTMEIRKKIKLSVNLRHQEQDMTSSELQERENIFADSSTFYHTNTQKHQISKRNGGILFMDMQPNINNKIIVAAMVERESKEVHNNRLYNTTTSRMDTLNTGMLNNNDSAVNKTLDVTTSYSHKFGKSGRILSLQTSLRKTWQYSYQFNISQNNVFRPLYSADTINQHVSPKNEVYSGSISATYSEPIGKYWSLALYYSIQNAITKNRQNTYDFNILKHDYIPNDSLTYRFDSRIINHTAKPSLTYNRGKLMLIGSAGLSLSTLTSDNYTTRNKAVRHTTYVDRALSAIIKIDPFKTINITLNGITLPLDAQLLWPINNNSNPLYIQLGNPGLINAFANSLSFSYFSNSIKGMAFAHSLEGRYIQHSFSTAVFTDTLGRQVSMPINVSGNWGINDNTMLGFKIKNPGITVNYSNAFEYNRTISQINHLDNIVKRYSLLQLLAASFNWRKRMEFTTRIGIDYRGNMLSLQNDHYTDFVQYTLALNVSAWLPLDFNVGSNIQYTNNTDAATHFTLLNGWFGKTFLPNRSLSAKFYAFDLLRQNKSVVAYYGSTYRERLETTNLAQYFMFSLTYAYGRKGTKPPIPKMP